MGSIVSSSKSQTKITYDTEQKQSINYNNYPTSIKPYDYYEYQPRINTNASAIDYMSYN